MSEFILEEESFKLEFWGKVPSPQEGECFLLCQTGAGMANSMVINYGIKYSSADIRHRHYNRKITFSLDEKEFNQNYRIVMEDQDFCFDVSVKMFYALQDAQSYFFQGKMEEGDISHTVRNAVRQQDRKWDAWEDIELKSSLENEIEKRLKRYEGVSFKRLEVIVVPEEAAKKMRESNKQKKVGIHISQNESEEQIAKNEQAVRIADSEQKLRMKQISDMAVMWKNFGNMGSIVDEYLKGNMDGKEFYDYLSRARSENLSVLQTAASSDMLTQKEMIERLSRILANNEFLQAEEPQKLLDGGANKSEGRYANTVEDDSQSGEAERYRDGTERKDKYDDGDYLI